MSDLPSIYSRPYNSWSGMKSRCSNPNLPLYKYYGGRGIKVCDKWCSFKGFWEDMGPTYKAGLSIDRIDNNGDYEPDNCRWATHKEQCNNRRSNTIIEIDGVTKTLAQWCDLSGLKRTTIIQRHFGLGWDFKRALELKEETWQAIIQN